MTKVPVLIIALVTAAAALPRPAAGAYERRSEALQLYQEGLFQETGTGDLALAQKIYTTLAETYADYRDIAAVAIYHLGLTHEKQGRQDEARRWFKHLTIHYVDQERVTQKARAKLEPTEAKAAPAKTTPTPEATPAPTVAAASTTPAAATTPPTTAQKKPKPKRKPRRPAPSFFPSWGVGADYAGVHVRKYVTPEFFLEAGYRWMDEVAGAGLRGVIELPPWWKEPHLRPYLGCEGGLLYDASGWAGYRMEAFAGLEFRPWTGLGLHADAGFDYRNLTEATDDRIRTGVQLNAGATFYF